MRIFEEFLKQTQKLFSSKQNAGKLVYNLADRLHLWKLLLLGLSLVLLVGYSQFRSNFECQGSDQVHRKDLTNFCWVNGTTTLNSLSRPSGNDQVKSKPSLSALRKLKGSKDGQTRPEPKAFKVSNLIYVIKIS